jgi:dTDP-glucose 4,6-dehydratase
MNILVTGGLGTIGSGLTKEFRKRGHHVIQCDLYHTSDEVGFSIHPDVEDPGYARCDIGKFQQIERVFEKLGPFDYVYHCAAEFGRWNGEDFYESLWQTNAIGTKNIIRLQERMKFKLIFFSSSEVYGDWPNIMIETVMDNYEIKQLNDYAMTKWVGEMQIRNSAQLYNTESVIVRLFNTYGPGEYYSPYRSVNCRFLYCALHGLHWTVYRGHYRTSTYLDDAVNTLANIVDNFINGEVYNIGGDYYHSIEELSDCILKVTNADRNLVRYRNSEKLTTKEKKVDIYKSIRDLNHKNTIDLETGVELTKEWMCDVYRHSIKA